VKDVSGTRARGNLRWAVHFAVVDLGLAMAAGSLIDRVGATGTRVAHGLVALTIALAPVAFLWIVAEAHLRWSPRGRVARGIIGWTLVATCIVLLLSCAPVAFYLFIMNLGYAFHW
jgi:hypothetical protein